MGPLRITKQKLWSASPTVQSLLLDLNLVSSHRGYTKFIILGRSRTGSNFLRGLLSSLPGVTVLGEILKNPVTIEWGTDNFPRTARADRNYQRDPGRFLDVDVFRPMPVSVDALGFKLFYYHGESERFASAWSYLLECKDLHVIHIKRRNILATHVSRARALRSNRWVAKEKPTQTLAPIKLDFDALLADFTQTRGWEVEFDRRFSDHRVLQLQYEDLVRDRNAEMTRVQRFLGLDPSPSQPQTFKQTRRPLDQVIANFDELRAQFQGTEWESFFTRDVSTAEGSKQ